MAIVIKKPLKKLEIYCNITMEINLWKFHLLSISFIKKTDTCHDHPEKSSATKLNTHTAGGYSLFTQCLFDSYRNKHYYCRGKDFIKNILKILERM